MASIENRSSYKITVKHRDDLTQTFAHNAKKTAEAYCDALLEQRLKPKLSRLNDSFVVRTRSVSNKNQTLVAHSEIEANDIKLRLEPSNATDYSLITPRRVRRRSPTS